MVVFKKILFLHFIPASRPISNEAKTIIAEVLKSVHAVVHIVRVKNPSCPNMKVIIASVVMTRIIELSATILISIAVFFCFFIKIVKDIFGDDLF